jgi:lipopolysaccharide transport system permease protein
MREADEATRTHRHTVVIEPNRGWFDVPWREIREYSDLIWLFVRRDWTARFKQTVLGPLWMLITPVIGTLVQTVFLGKVMKAPTDGLPQYLFYLCGGLGWGYFASCMSGTSGVLVGNASLFGKVYFPRLIIPFYTVMGNLINYGIQFATFAAFWIFFKFFTSAGPLIHLRPSALLLPLLLVQSAALGLGIGLWSSAITVKYRDLRHVVSFLQGIWMWATPILYPLSQVPEKWRWLSLINPMTNTLEFFRYSLLGTGTVSPLMFILSSVITLIVLASGIAIFNRTERTFIDTV